MEAALEAGAEDVDYGGDVATIYAAPADFLEVKTALEGAEYTFLSAETGYVPQNTVTLQDKSDAKKVLALLAALDEHDDVQSVYANYDMPQDWVEELSA